MKDYAQDLPRGSRGRQSSILPSRLKAVTRTSLYTLNQSMEEEMKDERIAVSKRTSLRR